MHCSDTLATPGGPARAQPAWSVCPPPPDHALAMHAAIQGTRDTILKPPDWLDVEGEPTK